MKRVVKAEEGEVYDIELDAEILEANRRIAEENRSLLRRYNVTAIDVMGSTGTGKTTLIAGMIRLLKGRYRIAVMKGDLTTTIDAEAISRYDVDVVPINTGKECHLDANLVRKALRTLKLEDLDLIFIENVGNLICPAEFPLGSEKRVVVVSVTEGPYMIVKHPFIFMDADVIVINKIDLAEAMGVEVDKLRMDAETINPRAKVVQTNCRSGEGVGEVVKALGLM
ncbi:MAG: hydrogenase nickel incorporation protein HypB [Candidatus Bathyarchaeota archaeon B26-2]|nr:MAG: hydrogenase nickel incorporation protein HypB [Candidatus Bathyarchaeota archaeon B26-2]